MTLQEAISLLVTEYAKARGTVDGAKSALMLAGPSIQPDTLAKVKEDIAATEQLLLEIRTRLAKEGVTDGLGNPLIFTGLIIAAIIALSATGITIEICQAYIAKLKYQTAKLQADVELVRSGKSPLPELGGGEKATAALAGFGLGTIAILALGAYLFLKR